MDDEDDQKYADESGDEDHSSAHSEHSEKNFDEEGQELNKRVQEFHSIFRSWLSTRNRLYNSLMT